MKEQDLPACHKCGHRVKIKGPKAGQPLQIRKRGTHPGWCKSCIDKENPHRWRNHTPKTTILTEEQAQHARTSLERYLQARRTRLKRHHTPA